MWVLGALIVVLLVGWVVIKVITLVAGGLVHLLIAGLPILTAIAAAGALLLSALITARLHRWRNVRPSRPPSASACRTQPASRVAVPVPESPNRVAVSAFLEVPTPSWPQDVAASRRAGPRLSSGSRLPGTLEAGQGVKPPVPAPRLPTGEPRSPVPPANHTVGSRIPVEQARLPYGARGVHVAAAVVKRVVYIDRSSGVQYGQGNDQYTLLRISLPDAALKSSAALAWHLLGKDTQCSRYVFSHDGYASFTGQAGTGGFFLFEDVTEELTGDTLVIIRNSRGIQVGDGNTQYNEFRTRAHQVTITIVEVGQTPEIRAAVGQLRQRPSWKAAELLANLVANAAMDQLIFDLTAQVTRELGDPVIRGNPAEIDGVIAAQAGGSARSYRTVKVEGDVNVDRLTKDLLHVARIAVTREAIGEASEARHVGEAGKAAATSPAAEILHDTMSDQDAWTEPPVAHRSVQPASLDDITQASGPAIISL
jgi:hypothetical protein